MNVPALPKVAESRKLTGLALTILAMIAVLIIFIVCTALFGTPWEPCRDILAFITGASGSHQLSQGASDVSKWRSQNQPPNIP